MAEHLPYYGHEQGCYNSKIPWGPEPCPGCVALRRAFSRGQRDERERHANELDVAVAKARAEVVTVDLAGDFNYVKGYNDGLVEGDAKGRREGERIGIQKALVAWKEAEPLHDAEVRTAALDAARDAVAALPEYRMRDTCIAAIEQLREEKK